MTGRPAPCTGCTDSVQLPWIGALAPEVRAPAARPRSANPGDLRTLVLTTRRPAIAAAELHAIRGRRHAPQRQTSHRQGDRDGLDREMVGTESGWWVRHAGG